jgi:hypothetical protein
VDRHYHEFEDWQLDWLLGKTGWKIIFEKKFTHPVKKMDSVLCCVIYNQDITWYMPKSSAPKNWLLL